MKTILLTIAACLMLVGCATGGMRAVMLMEQPTPCAASSDCIDSRPRQETMRAKLEHERIFGDRYPVYLGLRDGETVAGAVNHALKDCVPGAKIEVLSFWILAANDGPAIIYQPMRIKGTASVRITRGGRSVTIEASTVGDDASGWRTALRESLPALLSSLRSRVSAAVEAGNI